MKWKFWTIVKLIYFTVTTVLTIAYFKEFRKTDTWIDIWHIILQLDLDLSKENENPRVSSYRKITLSLYVGTIIYGAFTFMFDNRQLIIFESSSAPPLLLNIVLFEVLWLRYLFYITSFAAVIGIFASIFGCLLQCLRTEEYKMLDQIYEYIWKKNFNLKLFYKENKDIIDTAEFQTKELATLKDFCMITYNNDHKFETCIICFSELDNEEKVIELPDCKHIYHYNCLEPWIKKNNKCPICKGLIRFGLLNAIHRKVVGKEEKEEVSDAVSIVSAETV